MKHVRRSLPSALAVLSVSALLLAGCAPAQPEVTPDEAERQNAITGNAPSTAPTGAGASGGSSPTTPPSSGSSSGH